MTWKKLMENDCRDIAESIADLTPDLQVFLS